MRIIRKYLFMLIALTFSFTMSGLAQESQSTNSNANAPTEAVAVEATSTEAAQPVAPEAKEQVAEKNINILESIVDFAKSTGIARILSLDDESKENGTTDGWKSLIMLMVACLLIYLAVVKQFEPLLLLPIAFEIGRAHV